MSSSSNGALGARGLMPLETDPNKQKSSRTTSTRSAETPSAAKESSDASKQMQKPSVARAFERLKSKVARKPRGAEILPGTVEDFERQKAKEVLKQTRKDDYGRLGLGDQTTFGMKGEGSFNFG